MSDLTAKFTSFEEQMAAQHDEVMAVLATLDTNIGGIGEAITVLNNAMQAGFRSMQGAIGQTGACFPCPTPSIVVPPIDTTTNPIDEDRCKRAQAIVATIGNILAAYDTMQSFNVIGTFNVINDAITEVIAAIAAGDTVPLPSFPEAIGIVGNYISYAADRIFTGLGLVEQYSPLHDALVDAVFAGATAGASQAGFNAIIDGSSIDSFGRYLIEGTGYSALWNYYLDPSTTPDLSGFDGSACVLVGCQTLDSVVVGLEARGGSEASTNMAMPPFGVTGTDTLTFTGFAPYNFDADAVWVGDFFGWTFNYISGFEYFLACADAGGAIVANLIVSAGNPTRTLAVHTAHMWVACNTNTGGADDPFSVEVCPAEV